MGTNSVDEFGHREQASRFGHGPLAMDPFGFNGIEPRALDGQATNNEAAAAILFDPTIVSFDPVSDLVAKVPGGIIPDQEQGPFTLASKVSQQPSQKSTGEGTNGTALDKT